MLDILKVLGEIHKECIKYLGIDIDLHREEIRQLDSNIDIGWDTNLIQKVFVVLEREDLVLVYIDEYNKAWVRNALEGHLIRKMESEANVTFSIKVVRGSVYINPPLQWKWKDQEKLNEIREALDYYETNKNSYSLDGANLSISIREILVGKI